MNFKSAVLNPKRHDRNFVGIRKKKGRKRENDKSHTIECVSPTFIFDHTAFSHHPVLSTPTYSPPSNKHKQTTSHETLYYCSCINFNFSKKKTSIYTECKHFYGTMPMTTDALTKASRTATSLSSLVRG